MHPKLSENVMLFNLKNMACVIISASLLSGCNQSPKSSEPTPSKPATSASVATVSSVSATTQATSQPTSQVDSPTISQNTVKETDTAKALVTVMSGLLFKSLNDNSVQKLTTEQKACLETTHYDQFLPTFQQYLQSKLTADELTKTNQYYALPVGQKQIQLAKQQLHTANGEKVSNPVMLSDDEKLQMQAFQSTPEGQKLGQLLSVQNQPELQRVLTEPMTAKVMAECHIPLENLAKGEQKVASSTASSTKP